MGEGRLISLKSAADWVAAVPALRDKLHTGTTILLDDCHRREEKETLRRWLAEEPLRRCAATLPQKSPATMLPAGQDRRDQWRLHP